MLGTLGGIPALEFGLLRAMSFSTVSEAVLIFDPESRVPEMMRIEGPQTLDKIEDELRVVEEGRTPALQLPVRPKRYWLGGELGLIQVVVTWARKNDPATLVTHINAGEDPSVQLAQMSERMFGFAAILMATDIRSRELQVSLRRQAYEKCSEVTDRMRGPITGFSIGPKLFFICTDHSTKTDIPWLYSGRDQVKVRSEFELLIRQMCHKISRAAADLEVLRGRIGDIAAIVHELFKNTHDWGRKDRDGEFWRRSIRGISIERHSWSIEMLDSVSQTNRPLAAYLKSIVRFNAEMQHSRERYNNVRFFEFSVFDSGVGLAESYAASRNIEKYTLTDELQFCMACLRKHISAASSPFRGLGLAQVMKSLSELKAFLRIRTGRLSLYRDFINLPLDFDTEDVGLFDCATCTSAPTEHARAFGAFYQIVVPIHPAK